MKCCVNCFSSPYIKGIITTENNPGTCDFCHSKDVPVKEAEELSYLFQDLLSLYKPDSTGKPIERALIEDFDKKIFSEKLNESDIKKLITEILKNEKEYFEDILTQPVNLSFKIHSDPSKIIEPLHSGWENFVDEIKYKNRFHIQNTLDLEKLEKLLRRYKKSLRKGKIFYRARISPTPDGFPKEQMGNPPPSKAKPGRANPLGISYLYLADDIKTAIAEVRAIQFDYVSIGKFRLKEDIEIINLRGNTYDPLLILDEGGLESLEDFLIFKPFIERLEAELSKPKRRSDSDLDYIPTQYLSEFIKYIGFKGVEYKSSVYPEGYNLAIFYPEFFECIDVEVYEIINVAHVEINRIK